jgi:hypothetical protein
MKTSKLMLLTIGAVLFSGNALALDDVTKGEPVEVMFDVNKKKSSWDFPWPCDYFLTDEGTADLGGFPTGMNLPAWFYIPKLKERFTESVFGFNLNSPVYFRFTGPLDPGLIPPRIENPSAADPFMIVKLEGKGPRLVPVDAVYWDKASGDPFLENHMLAIAPVVARGFYPGTTYAAVITHRLHGANNMAGKRSEAFDELWRGRGDPELAAAFRLDQLKAALSEIGLAEKRVVAATVFTTIDTDRMAGLIAQSLKREMSGEPYSEITGFKEVREVELKKSGKSELTYIVRYKEGGEDTTRVGGAAGEDLIEVTPDKYPYRIFEGRAYTTNFQGPLSDKPYGSRWLLTDVNNRTGRIKFKKDAKGGLALDVKPVPEPVRFALYIPHDGKGNLLTNCPMIIWETGTGGTAYSPVRRLYPDDKTIEVMKVMASHGFAVLCYDLQLHGQRYPLVEEGMNLSMTYNNILNLYAMQGNIMQSSIDGAAMSYLARLYLNDFLAGRPEIGRADIINVDKIMLFGHSLGGGLGHLTLHLATFDHALLSGGVGHEMLFMERTDQMPADVMKAIAWAVGVPVWSWDRMDRFHPVPLLVQGILEPADALNYAYGVTTPTTYFMGIGDVHVPNETTRALHAANPVSVLVEFIAGGPYDPHFCTWREQAAYDELDRLLGELE